MEAVVTYNADTLREVESRMAALAGAMQQAAEEMAALAGALQERRDMDVTERWTQQWGEVVNKKTAAHMLSVSVAQINRMIAAGELETSKDGRNRVLVRSAAERIAKGAPDAAEDKPKPRPQQRKRKAQGFIP